MTAYAAAKSYDAIEVKPGGKLELLVPSDPTRPMNGGTLVMLTGLADPQLYPPWIFDSACEGLENKGFIVDREAKTFKAVEIGRYTIEACSMDQIVSEFLKPLGIDVDTFRDELAKHAVPSTSNKLRSFVPMRYVGDAIRAACDSEQEPIAQRLLMSAVPSVDWVEMD